MYHIQNECPNRPEPKADNAMNATKITPKTTQLNPVSTAAIPAAQNRGVQLMAAPQRASGEAPPG